MSVVLLLIPDLLLIALGFALFRAHRYTGLNREVWDGVEKVVYTVLFPVLLFHSVSKTTLSLSAAGFVGVTVATVLVGIGASYALGWATRRGPAETRLDPQYWSSSAQVAFRFNSYVALALAERLAGPLGVSLIALVVGFCVPLCNVASVYPLARHRQTAFLGEIVRNPLIVATLAGLAANALGWRVPEVVAPALTRVGQASLALGLMTVGAGLQFGTFGQAPKLGVALLAIKHAVMPAAAIGLIAATALQGPQRLIAMMFAAMPTASSCYVLAVRMGGNGAYVAGLVTVSTLLGLLTLPFWLWVVGVVV
jgi:malonate transporter and related proteins